MTTIFGVFQKLLALLREGCQMAEPYRETQPYKKQQRLPTDSLWCKSGYRSGELIVPASEELGKEIQNATAEQVWDWETAGE